MTDRRQVGVHLELDESDEVYRLTVSWASNGVMFDHIIQVDRFHVHKLGVRFAVDEMKKGIEPLKQTHRDLLWSGVTKALDDAYKVH